MDRSVGIVRAATAADADLVAQLNRHVQQVHHDSRPQVFKPVDVDRTRPMYEARLSDPTVKVFLAFLDTAPAGYVLARVVDQPETALTFGARVVVLDEISVDPTARREGVGRALVNAVKALAADLDIDRIDLSVWRFNDEARAFFESQGFMPSTDRLTTASWA
jgi:ribosomal protein S18 acetylase RimI-like enzyme